MFTHNFIVEYFTYELLLSVPVRAHFRVLDVSVSGSR